MFKDSRQNSEFYRLLSHPFIISVLENQHRSSSPLTEEFRQLAKQKKASEHNSTRKTKRKGLAIKLTLNSEQVYHYAVFYYSFNLTHVIERLEEVPLYLSRFPNSPTFKKNGITLHKWVHYHYSNYLITAVSTYDLVLLLTNAVLALGIDPRNCNDKTVLKNKVVQQVGISPAIKAVKEVTKDYKEPRNLYVHHGSLPSLNLLDTFESYRFIEEANELLGIQDSGEPIMHPRIAQLLYQDERRKLIKDLRVRLAAITEAVIKFFDTLPLFYSAYTEYFKPKL